LHVGSLALATAADCKLFSVPPSSILEPGGLGDPSILTVSSGFPLSCSQTHTSCALL